MKKIIVISIAAIMVVGMFILVKLMIGNDIEAKTEANIVSEDMGKRLVNMENAAKAEADDLSVTLRQDREDAAARQSIKTTIMEILDSISELDDKETCLRVMANCEVIGYLAGIDEDKGKFTDEEITLRKHELLAFTREVFGYGLAVIQNEQEKLNRIEIEARAREIEKNADSLTEDFVRCLLAARFA